MKAIVHGKTKTIRPIVPSGFVQYSPLAGVPTVPADSVGGSIPQTNFYS